ncbi:MAG: lycopene cyclase domain-containing protein, partial [Bacteroidota bacterium]
METNALYLILNMASILPPLLLSFDSKVAYYRRWRYLFPAILIVAAVFIAWDVWFTAMGVWGFNARYLTGLHLGNLPLEECLFFITIPYSSVFIYDCFKAYFPGWKFPRMGIVLAWVLAAAMLVLGVLFIDRWYTGLTFLLLAALLVVQAVRKP